MQLIQIKEGTESSLHEQFTTTLLTSFGFNQGCKKGDSMADLSHFVSRNGLRLSELFPIPSPHWQESDTMRLWLRMT